MTASDSTDPSGLGGPGLLEAVWRYRWLVLVLTLLGGALAYGASLLQSPTYEAQARLLVTDPAVSGLFADADEVGERFIANQTEVANSPDVDARAAELLGDGMTEDRVGAAVEVRPSESVDVLTIVAVSGSPEEAAALANAVGTAYQDIRTADIQQRADRSIAQLGETMARLRERITEADQQLAADPGAPTIAAERDAAAEQLASFEARADEIAVDAALYGSGVERFTEARPPETPTAPRPRRNAALGLVLGALAGTGIAWQRAERSRAALHRLDPAPVLRAPLLAQVPEYRSARVAGLDPARSAPDSAAGEAYQFLLSSLEYALARTGGRSVVVTSAGRGAGKTLTAFNLAVAAVRDGRRVILCDGDARTRGLTALTDTAPSPGLTDLADESVPFEGATAVITVPATRGLQFVAAGNPPPDPAGFFRTGGFRTALRRIQQRADLVVIDTPPILAVSDTSAIAGQADGLIVVVPKGTSLKELSEARERLDFVGTPVLGYVYNRAGRPTADYAYRPPDEVVTPFVGGQRPRSAGDAHAAATSARHLEARESRSRTRPA